MKMGMRRVAQGCRGMGLLALAAVVTSVFSAFGAATALIHNTAEDPDDCPAGIYLSESPSGKITKLLDEKVFWAAFSPDGRQIAYTMRNNGDMYMMDNDGTNKVLLKARADCAELSRMYWTSNGIMWQGEEDKLYRLIPQTKEFSEVIAFQTLGPLCGDEGGWGFHCSRDGRRAWLKTGHDPLAVDSLYCGVRGYQRGGRGYFHFAPDFSAYKVLWRSEWGHGDGMSSDGTLFLAELGKHRNLQVTRQWGDSLAILYDRWELVPPYEGECREYGQCVNNDSMLVSKLIYWNWVENKTLGTFNKPSGAERYMFSMWNGALPDPRSTQPRLIVNAVDVLFDGTDTLQTLMASTSVGTLGELKVVVPAAATGWLSVATRALTPATAEVTVWMRKDNLPALPLRTQFSVSLASGEQPQNLAVVVTRPTGTAAAAGVVPSALQSAAVRVMHTSQGGLRVSAPGLAYTGAVQVKLFTLDGRQVFGALLGAQRSIDISQPLRAGLYYLQLWGERNELLGRVSVMKGS